MESCNLDDSCLSDDSDIYGDLKELLQKNNTENFQPSQHTTELEIKINPLVEQMSLLDELIVNDNMQKQTLAEKENWEREKIREGYVKFKVAVEHLAYKNKILKLKHKLSTFEIEKLKKQNEKLEEEIEFKDNLLVELREELDQIYFRRRNRNHVRVPSLKTFPTKIASSSSSTTSSILCAVSNLSKDKGKSGSCEIDTRRKNVKNDVIVTSSFNKDKSKMFQSKNQDIPDSACTERKTLDSSSHETARKAQDSSIHERRRKTSSNHEMRRKTQASSSRETEGKTQASSSRETDRKTQASSSRETERKTQVSSSRETERKTEHSSTYRTERKSQHTARHLTERITQHCSKHKTERKIEDSSGHKVERNEEDISSHKMGRRTQESFSLKTTQASSASKTATKHKSKEMCKLSNRKPQNPTKTNHSSVDTHNSEYSTPKKQMLENCEKNTSISMNSVSEEPNTNTQEPCIIRDKSLVSGIIVNSNFAQIVPKNVYQKRFLMNFVKTMPSTHSHESPKGKAKSALSSPLKHQQSPKVRDYLKHRQKIIQKARLSPYKVPIIPSPLKVDTLKLFLYQGRPVSRAVKRSLNLSANQEFPETRPSENSTNGQLKFTPLTAAQKINSENLKKEKTSETDAVEETEMN